MKKTIFSIALVALLFIATSGYNRGDAAIQRGVFAPEFTVSNEQNSLKLSQLRGKYVLLTFWDSADAPSRVDCNKYSAWFNANKPENVRHLMVNFDKQPQLLQEIAKSDNLNSDVQYNVQGSEAERIMRDFCLDEGFGSVLIGPDGRILEFDPTISELSSLSL